MTSTNDSNGSVCGLLRLSKTTQENEKYEINLEMFGSLNDVGATSSGYLKVNSIKRTAAVVTTKINKAAMFFICGWMFVTKPYLN